MVSTTTATSDKPRRIVVIGAGGFGRETLDVIEAITAAGLERYVIEGVVDRSPSSTNLRRLRDRDIPYLGTDDEWLRNPTVELFAVGVGDPHLRDRLASRYVSAGLRPATLVHPTANIGRQTTIAEGVIVCAGAVLSNNVQVAAYVTINPQATIGYDARLKVHASVNPGAIISDGVVIGERSLIGAGAVVMEHRLVGAACVVGASACVTRDLPDRSVVRGVPAR